MRLTGRNLMMTLLLVAAFALVSLDTASAQTSAAAATEPTPTTQPPAANPAPAANSNTQTPPKTYTVPAGTKVLLQLTSSLNTKSAQAGDGVYLSSAFPVVVGNRVISRQAFSCREWLIAWRAPGI